MTPIKWIEQTNAIGIVLKAGRYGGETYEHSDIANDNSTKIPSQINSCLKTEFPVVGEKSV